MSVESKRAEWQAGKAREAQALTALGVDVGASRAREAELRAAMRAVSLAEFPVYERARAEREARKRGLRLAYLAEALFMVPNTYIARETGPACLSYIPRGWQAPA